MALALASQKRTHVGKAKRRLIRLTDKLPEYRKRRVEAQIAYALGKYDTALAQAEIAAGEEPCKSFRMEYLLFSALCAGKAGLYRKSIRSAKRVVELVLSDSLGPILYRKIWHHANFLASAGLANIDQPEEAISFLKAALVAAKRRERGLLLLILADMQIQEERMGDAVGTLKRAARYREQRKEAESKLSNLEQGRDAGD